jgi:alpha-D-ribose 1-methylphosphonate 5-triphosphate synthase subunit PhnH
MVREVRYDEVFDAQKHFRSLLDSMARPGKINRLDPVPLDTPPGLNAATALIAFSLMDADSTFDVINMAGAEAGYLAANTNAQRTETARAHFIFAGGIETADFLDEADCGTLLYPDTSATVILQVANAAAEALSSGLRLTLEGPGIDGKACLHIAGLNEDVLLALQARNAEFPMGLDTILTFADHVGNPCVVCLPRTTRVVWEKC